MFQHELITIENQELKASQELTDLLNRTKVTITKAEFILSQPIESLNDQEVTDIIKEMNQIKKFDKQFDGIKKAIRQYFKQIQDQYLNEFESLLNQHHYAELETVIKKIDHFKRDALTMRKVKNWKIVEDYYNDTINEYTIDLKSILPKTYAFETFQLEHENLANSNKTWRLKKSDKEVINQYIQTHANVIETFKTFNEEFKEKLIDYYDNTRDLPNTIQLHDHLTKQKEEQLKLQEQRIQEEAERRAKELLQQQEIERLAKEKVEQEELKRQKQELLNASFNQTIVTDIPFAIQDDEQMEHNSHTIVEAIASIAGIDASDTSEKTAVRLVKIIMDAAISRDPKFREYASSSKTLLNTIKEILAHANVI